MEISPVGARILGCLLEKRRTTPDQYPLSLNALVNACNQTTNRWPVVRYDEDTVEAGLDQLRALELIRREKPHGGRAIKYSEMLAQVIPMGEAELALMGVLLLRGPQTVGELKGRTERLYEFADLASVDGALALLSGHEDGPWVEQLARESGRKEPRWRELLSGARVDEPADDVADVTPAGTPLAARLDALEAEVARLTAFVDGLGQDRRQ